MIDRRAFDFESWPMPIPSVASADATTPPPHGARSRWQACFSDGPQIRTWARIPPPGRTRARPGRNCGRLARAPAKDRPTRIRTNRNQWSEAMKSALVTGLILALVVAPMEAMAQRGGGRGGFGGG